MEYSGRVLIRRSLSIFVFNSLLCGLLLLKAADASAQSLEPYPVCKSTEEKPATPCATAPKMTSSKKLAYSEDGRKNKIEGTVILELVVTADGTPQDIKVIRGLGHGLDEQAVVWLKDSHFDPGSFEGKPVPVRFTSYARFSMNGSTTGPAFPGPVTFEDARKLYSQARSAYNTGDYGLAIELATRVTELDPQDADAWNELGISYAALNDLDKAERAYKRQIEAWPQHTIAYNNLGLLHLRRRQYEAAIAQFRKQLEVDPGAHYSLVNLVEALQHAKRYKEAIAAAPEAVAAAPNNSYLYIYLLDCYLALGMQEEAAKTIDKAAALISSASNWNLLAWTLARHNAYLDRAEKYAKLAIMLESANLTAVSLDPLTTGIYSHVNSLGATWDTLGWILFLRGDINSAEKYLLASWSLSPDVTIADHLAQLYEKAGRKDEALKYSALGIAGLRDIPFPQDDDLDAAANARERLAKQMSSEQVKKSIEDARKTLHSTDSIAIANPAKQTGKAQFAILQVPDTAKSQARLMAGDKPLAPFADTLAAQTPRVSLPGDQDLELARWGKLNCPDATSPCTLTIATSLQAITDQRQSLVKTSTVAAMSAPGAYSSESLGIALQLPQGWSKSDESAGDNNNLTKVFFSKNNSLCEFIVMREHLQATEETYNKLVESNLSNLESMHELSTINVVRDGLTGVRRVINWEHKGVAWHGIVEIFTAGDLHYELLATAPLDDFQRDSAELDNLFASVRFPQLHVATNDLH